MTVHLYSLVLNEEKMLPYFFRHYDDLVDQYYLFDNGSTDRTLQLIADHPRASAEHVTFHTDSFVEEETVLYNAVWKQSRGVADWVIILNLDEHVYVDGMSNADYLAWCRDNGITTIPCVGFEMVADTFPQTRMRLCDSIKTGMRWDRMDKVLIFDPNAVHDINYELGRHTCFPSGRAIYPIRRDMKLLHYKYLGFDYLQERHQFLRKGLREKDVANKWGHKYLWSVDERRADFERVRSSAQTVIP
ncbi:MAG: glycosyltransferase family 2 protein [Saprospiraceae bacterium]|nr:glycosyltransferase family 2 protein [Saprospiraceae bacterium]